LTSAKSKIKFNYYGTVEGHTEIDSYESTKKIAQKQPDTFFLKKN